MTTIIKILDDTREWCQSELCTTFKFKVAPKENEPEDDTYNYRREYPKAYTLYPDKDNKYPSVTVQFTDSTIKGALSETQINLLFAVWNNGSHYLDDADVPSFKENYEGYRDVWNWIDLALSKILETEYIGEHIRIKKEGGVKVTPIKEDGTIPNFYPVFGASISFSVEYSAQQVQDEYI